MEIVGAFACSHAGLMITRGPNAEPAQRDRIYGAFREMGAAISALKPDAIVILATDHGRIHKLDGAVPQFTIGVSAEAQSIGDADLPKRTYPIHQILAQDVLASMIDEGFDLAFSEAMKIDHSIVSPLTLALGPEANPVLVPIIQNCNMPPTPRPARSRAFGAALGRAIRASGPGRAIVIGTGGLSHWVGQASFRDFLYRKPGERLPDLASQTMILTDTGPVAEDFDREFLDHVCQGRTADFIANWSPARILETAGNGAEEIRNWLAACAAVNDAKARVIAYEPVKEWLTGTGLVQFAI